MILTIEKSQNRSSDNYSIVLQLCSLLPLLGKSRIHNSPIRLSHIDLPLDHLRVKSEMTLRGEQLVSQIHTLDEGMIGAPPDMDIVPQAQQVGGLGRRRVAHMVLVHLMQVNARLVYLEQPSPDLCQLDLRMCQFPVVLRVRLDAAAQHAA